MTELVGVGRLRKSMQILDPGICLLPQDACPLCARLQRLTSMPSLILLFIRPGSDCYCYPHSPVTVKGQAQGNRPNLHPQPAALLCAGHAACAPSPPTGAAHRRPHSLQARMTSARCSCSCMQKSMSMTRYTKHMSQMWPQKPHLTGSGSANAIAAAQADQYASRCAQPIQLQGHDPVMCWLTPGPEGVVLVLVLCPGRLLEPLLEVISRPVHRTIIIIISRPLRTSASCISYSTYEAPGSMAQLQNKHTERRMALDWN